MRYIQNIEKEQKQYATLRFEWQLITNKNYVTAKKNEKQQEGENKNYFSYIIRIIYSNKLDSLTIPNGVTKLSQHA